MTVEGRGGGGEGRGGEGEGWRMMGSLGHVVNDIGVIHHFIAYRNYPNIRNQ